MDDIITILILFTGIIITLLFLGILKFKLMIEDFFDEVNSSFKQVVRLLTVISENKEDFGKINDMIIKLDAKYQDLADKIIKPISERGLKNK